MKFRKRYKVIFNITILTCILLLIAVTQCYLQKQKLLILESNNLLTSHYIQADKSINSVWEDKITPKDNIWIMGTLENIDNIKIISFYATKYKDIILPINKGEIFSSNDKLEAIVGENVPTHYYDNDEFFNYKDKEYKVIGKLGITDNSPLNTTVIINDSTFLESDYITLFFDGPDIDKISWLKGKEGNDIGVERWFNITKISKSIMYTVWLIVICSITLWVYFFNINSITQRKIHLQTGLNLKNILKKESKYLSCIFCISTVIVFSMIDINIFTIILKYYIILFFVVIILNIILFFEQTSKEKFYYD